MNPVTGASMTTSVAQEQKLRSLAGDLEVQFLAEMLKSAGVGKPRDALGGGAGEDQFSGFLTRAYAEATVNAGGIGLSEALYRALSQKETV